MHTTVIPFHLDMVPLSVFGFSIAAIACLVGLFSSHYRENWLQHVGLVMVGLASALKIHQTIERGFASGETAFLAIGIALFAAGVAWKVRAFAIEDAIKRKYGKPPTLKRAHK